MIYQTPHLFFGFILLPGGHLKALAKYSEFDSVPITLKKKVLTIEGFKESCVTSLRYLS